MSTEPSAVRGEVTWITAEDGGGGPDEGLAIGLGAGRYFYVGYISDDTWRNHGSAYTMDNTGWWLVTGPDMVPMARFPTPDDGREFIDLMAGLLQQKPALFRVSPDGSISIVNETQMADPLTEVRDDPWDEFLIMYFVPQDLHLASEASFHPLSGKSGRSWHGNYSCFGRN